MTARRTLISFYVKFYVVCILFVIFIDKIFYYKPVLLVLNGFVLVPQICKNVYMKARNVPDTKYIVSMTITQSFLPLYLNG